MEKYKKWGKISAIVLVSIIAGFTAGYLKGATNLKKIMDSYQVRLSDPVDKGESPGLVEPSDSDKSPVEDGGQLEIPSSSEEVESNAFDSSGPDNQEEEHAEQEPAEQELVQSVKPLTITETLTYPANGEISNGLGWKRDPELRQWNYHSGIHIEVEPNTPIVASLSGRVIFIGEVMHEGLTVALDHGNGLETKYSGLGSVSVKEGAAVEKGCPIGNSITNKSSGIHFEIRLNNKILNPKENVGKEFNVGF